MIRSQSQSSTSPPGDCKQTNGVEERVSVGDEVGVSSTVSKGKIIRADPDLDCTGGPRANPPSPPPYDDDAQAAAPSFNLYPDLTANEEPANSATGGLWQYGIRFPCMETQ
ncbi:unnamed protein product [Arctogadus glacialis]